MLKRSIVIFSTAFLLFVSMPAWAYSEPVRIVAFGDGLTRGKGIAKIQAYPENLKQMLLARGHDVEVYNAGVNYERTKSALTRVDKIIAAKPDIVILALGTSDMAKKTEPAVIFDHIDKIMQKLRDAGITMVLVGRKAPVDKGLVYRAKFNAIYTTLEDKYGVIFMPNFMKGIERRQEYFRVDGIYPTPRGHEIMASNLMSYVEEALEQKN